MKDPEKILERIKVVAEEKIKAGEAMLDYGRRMPLSKETFERIREVTELEMRGYKDILGIINE